MNYSFIREFMVERLTGIHLIKYVLTEFKNILHTPIRLLQQIRCEIGIYILLALDFLIASGIIQTITEMSQIQLIELGVMIMFRTMIGFFLGKEVDKLETIGQKNLDKKISPFNNIFQ